MERARPGDYFKRDYYGITIYGYAMTDEEVLAQETALGASEEEARWIVRNIKIHYQRRGLLYGRAASVACVEGEYGSTPAKETIAITREEYEAAEAREWTD